MKRIKEEIDFNGKKLSIETGHMAKQANGSVVVRSGNTTVLVTACMSKEPRIGADFFPLTVEFQEKMYSAGKIPGGFFKREARPSDMATLTARLIDRPIRPLFPEGFHNDVQIVVTVLSFDDENDPDVLGMIGASAALCISDIPFSEPIGAVEVGLINDEFVINPSSE
ncbi:polyribonucleotide nucleotidyltransferase, partial [Candidatus Margulisiibacteriota bacterium]